MNSNHVLFFAIIVGVGVVGFLLYQELTKQRNEINELMHQNQKLNKIIYAYRMSQFHQDSDDLLASEESDMNDDVQRIQNGADSESEESSDSNSSDSSDSNNSGDSLEEESQENQRPTNFLQGALASLSKFARCPDIPRQKNTPNPNSNVFGGQPNVFGGTSDNTQGSQGVANTSTTQSGNMTGPCSVAHNLAQQRTPQLQQNPVGGVTQMYVISEYQTTQQPQSHTTQHLKEPQTTQVTPTPQTPIVTQTRSIRQSLIPKVDTFDLPIEDQPIDIPTVKEFSPQYVDTNVDTKTLEIKVSKANSDKNIDNNVVENYNKVVKEITKTTIGGATVGNVNAKTVKYYVDNAINRKLNRVGNPYN